ncbi:hypothetical protein Fot_52673 [Forsythia ovata]|uniref:Uncharacterized protein n=1 Tax=Forsythia ovata TaxID=205694 RepID=A0ABD1PLD1_9LAMI
MGAENCCKSQRAGGRRRGSRDARKKRKWGLKIAVNRDARWRSKWGLKIAVNRSDVEEEMGGFGDEVEAGGVSSAAVGEVTPAVGQRFRAQIGEDGSSRLKWKFTSEMGRFVPNFFFLLCHMY